MKIRTETVNWFREMWIMVAVGVAEAGLLALAVPHLFDNWGELGRVVAIAAVSKFFYFLKQSPLPRVITATEIKTEIKAEVKQEVGAQIAETVTRDQPAKP